MNGAQKVTLTFARVTIGVIATVHGLSYAFGLFGGPGIDEFAKQMEARMAVAADLTTVVVAYGLVLTGIFLVLGSFTRFAALFGLVLVVAEAFFGARYTEFFVRQNGIEYLLALAALSTVTVTFGPGAFCIDLREIWKKMRDRAKASAKAKKPAK